MLNVVFLKRNAECRNSELRFVECHYAKRHYVECHGAKNAYQSKANTKFSSR
jgi:hypothetical protein